jgi:hypothetical protein
VRPPLPILRAGELIDSCTVSSAPDDFDGYELEIGADEVGFEIIPADGFTDYVLVRDEPEVYDIEREGSGYQSLLWTFDTAGDDGDVTQEPTATAPQEPDGVSALPATGAGMTAANGSGFGLIGVVLMGLASVVIGGAVRRR